MEKLKRYKWVLLLLVVDLGLYLFMPGKGQEIAANTTQYLKQIATILPPIFILLGLFDIWVPRKYIIAHLGEESGLKGILLSFFLGSAAAGPLYAAFPIAQVLFKKGAGLFNILIFMGAWATTKLPMIFFEVASLGWKFGLTRLILSVIVVIFNAYLINKLTTSHEQEELYQAHKQEAA